MARKYWYHYTAEMMLLLFALGIISVSELPKYYCEPEDKIQGCMFIYNNNKTCAIPILDKNKNWTWKGDTCVKKGVYGEWELLEGFVRIPVKAEKIKGKKFNITRPIVMTNAKILRDLGDKKYVYGYCSSVVVIK
jgi:hypothetical protein